MSYIIPLADKIVEVLLTFLEVIKGILTVKITELKCKIYELQEKIKNDETPTKKIIGFIAPEEEDSDSDDV